MSATFYALTVVCVGFLTLTAFITGVAVRMAFKTHEPPAMQVSRNLLLGAWALLSFRIVYAIVEGSGRVPTIDLISLGMMALGATLMSSIRLFTANSGSPCKGCQYVQAPKSRKARDTHVPLV